MAKSHEDKQICTDLGLTFRSQLENSADLSLRVIVQVRSEPSLDLSQTHPLACVIVGNLVAINLAKAEIA